MSQEQELPQAARPSEGSALESGPAPESTAPQELRAQLEETERERAQFKALAQRAQADLVNYRQRVEREREEQQRAAVERTLGKLLPIVDDLQLALKHAPASGDDAWLDGIRIIERGLLALLESEGVAAIAPVGKPFDPWEHEALFSVEDPSKEPDTVAMVVRQGYKLHDRVLRPAQVAVVQVRAPSESQAQSPQVGTGGPEERKEP
ncbi:MAG: nucleotide exchange factor GrpE [Chloroflexi bacterium]|nr:nucleotide exchange factor GrpE [Chloroflexota bacterium]